MITISDILKPGQVLTRDGIVDAKCVPIANDNKYQPFPKREVYVCRCGCDRYELRPDGPYCGDCGALALGWINS